MVKFLGKSWRPDKHERMEGDKPWVVSLTCFQAGLIAAGITSPSDFPEIFDGCCAHREGKCGVQVSTRKT